MNNLFYTAFFEIFLILIGCFLVYSGSHKILSKKEFLKREKMLGINPVKEHKEIPEIDRFTERYFRPLGWVVAGIAAIILAIYLYFF